MGLTVTTYSLTYILYAYSVCTLTDLASSAPTVLTGSARVAPAQSATPQLTITVSLGARNNISSRLRTHPILVKIPTYISRLIMPFSGGTPALDEGPAPDTRYMAA